MKIAVCSDLHLEFGDLDLQNDEAADVLILGGDIFIAEELVRLADTEEASRLVPTNERVRAKRYYNFIEKCSQRFPNVILIAGNHEHYHGDFVDTLNIMKDAFAYLTNVHVLDKESITIDDVIFYGGTLWTDMNGEDPATMASIKFMLNDYNSIKNTVKRDGFYLKKFLPEDSVQDHKEFLSKLKDVLDANPNTTTVVVGHHAPSKVSTHPKYKHETLMNGAYSTELSNMILDHRQIKLWTHGHTHEEFDYMLGTTRVVCNPRGYDGYEDRADNFKLKYVEV
jgi:Icc-related predicted phosphoesterase